MSDVNRYELSRDMKPEEWPPVLVDELDYELMKRTAFQAQEMAKEIAAENATLKARLAEKDETIKRMQGLLETCDVGLDTLRARLAAAERDAKYWNEACDAALLQYDSQERSAIQNFLHLVRASADAARADDAVALGCGCQTTRCGNDSTDGVVHMSEHIDRLRAFAHWFAMNGGHMTEECKDALTLLGEYDVLKARLAEKDETIKRMQEQRATPPAEVKP